MRFHVSLSLARESPRSGRGEGGGIEEEKKSKVVTRGIPRQSYYAMRLFGWHHWLSSRKMLELFQTILLRVSLAHLYRVRKPRPIGHHAVDLKS